MSGTAAPDHRPAVLGWIAVPVVWLVAIAAARIDHADLGGYVWVTLIHAALYAVAAWWVLRTPDPPHAFLLVVAVALICRALAMTAEPNLTSDAYRYVWDGRIQWEGWNPYSHIPNDERLTYLRDETIWPHINQKERAVTIYPPFAEMLFAAANLIADDLRGPKIVMSAMDLAAMLAVFLWLQATGLPRERLLIYAWHPLPIWELTSQAHIDAAAIALMLFAIVAVTARRRLLGGAILALAIMTKYFPVVLLPALWRRWDWRMPAAMLAAAALLALPYWLAGRPNLLGYLGTHIDNEGYVAGWGFHIIWMLRNHTPFDPPGYIYIGLAVVLLAALALYIARDRVLEAPVLLGERGNEVRGSDEINPAHLLVLAAAFTWLTSPHYAWYFAWLVPFLALTPSASVMAMTLLSVVLYVPRPAGGTTWSLLFPIVFYLPLAVAGAMLLARRLAQRKLTFTP